MRFPIQMLISSYPLEIKCRNCFYIIVINFNSGQYIINTLFYCYEINIFRVLVFNIERSLLAQSNFIYWSGQRS